LDELSACSKGLYIYRTTQHRNTMTNIHASSGIRINDPSNQAAKTYALDRVSTGTGNLGLLLDNNICGLAMAQAVRRWTLICRFGFALRSVCVGFGAYKMALGRLFYKFFGLSPASYHSTNAPKSSVTAARGVP
jgi:hypothetical protein